MLEKSKLIVYFVTEMEDIAILWSSASPESALWSDYLVASFDKIMSQRARHHYRYILNRISCEQGKIYIEI